jgi:hypothetical protein
MFLCGGRRRKKEKKIAILILILVKFSNFDFGPWAFLSFHQKINKLLTCHMNTK